MNLALHAGGAVPRDAAEIEVVPRLLGAERDRRAGAFAGHPLRLGLLVGKDDIMLGPLAVDQGYLDNLPFGGAQHRVDPSVDGPSNAEKDHPALGDPRPQRVFDIRHVRHAVRHSRRRHGGSGLIAGGRERLRGRCGRGAGCRSGRTAGRLDEERDDVVAVMLGLQPGERHAVARNGLLRVGQVGGEGLRRPADIGALHRRRIEEPRLGPRLAADDARHARSDRVLAGVERMARLALAEHLLAGSGVARRANF